MPNQTHEYFAGFAYRDPASAMDAPFEYPLTPEQAIARTGIRNPNTIITSPPDGWATVYRSDTPVVPDLHVLRELNPVFDTALGKWVQAFEVLPMSPAEATAHLAKVRREKEIEINMSRTAANNGFFMFQGKRIACDELSMKDIIVTNMFVLRDGRLPTVFPGIWKSKDNEYITIPDTATWNSFFDAIFVQGNRNFMHSETLKQRIAQAPNLAEIRIINWNTDTGIPHS